MIITRLVSATALLVSFSWQVAVALVVGFGALALVVGRPWVQMACFIAALVVLVGGCLVAIWVPPL